MVSSPVSPKASPEPPVCPDCHRPLKKIWNGPPEEWICPIAVEAKNRGILGQPGRHHKHAYVFYLTA